MDFSPQVKPDGFSIIVTGRNDNYGGDFSKRLQTTMDWNLKHIPNSELIYVEWNQIKERASDCDWISKRYPNARCFVVSNEIHRKIAANPEKMPVMEYFAKNFGIRKARFNWILLINADCFIGLDVVKHLKTLSENSVYGTHYRSILWNGEELSKQHLTNKSKFAMTFSADFKMGAVVGNFILTKKSNWLKATGYDERLTNTRAGVDSNGLSQLFYMGLKPMVVGHHYHLDHEESIVKTGNQTHGDISQVNKNQNIPYRNSEDWGLHNYPLKQIGDRIWELQAI